MLRSEPRVGSGGGSGGVGSGWGHDPFLSVGPTPGGAAAELVVGRAAMAPGASMGAGARPATQGVGGVCVGVRW